jgi:TPR repeat protein
MKSPTPADAFGREQCSAAHKDTADLMAWGWHQRAELNQLHHRGVVAVRHTVKGCSVEIEVLPNCIVEGRYSFAPYSVNESKVAHNETELMAQLPLGGAGLRGKLTGTRALRTDYMVAGLDALAPGVMFQMSDLRGAGCERATHVVSKVYLGGFAVTAGESRALDASASFFGAGAGARQAAKAESVYTEGDAQACAASQRDRKPNAGCEAPLRVGLMPIAGLPERYCTAAPDCETECNAGQSASCAALAAMYFNGQGVPQDPVRAAKLSERACNDQHAVGCANLANQYFQGIGVAQNREYAAHLSYQACQAGVGPACGLLAMMYKDGQGAPVDVGRAAYYYFQGCSMGDMPSCAWSKELHGQACERGDMPSCMTLAGQYREGAGIAVDFPKAAELYAKACLGELGVACGALGVLLTEGAPGFPVNLRDAPAYLAKACTLFDAYACGYLGSLYDDGRGVPKDPARAFALYSEACDRGEPIGCAELANMYDEGKSIPQDQAKAQTLYQRACQNGFQPACEELTPGAAQP